MPPFSLPSPDWYCSCIQLWQPSCITRVLMCGTICMTSFSLLDLIALILQRVQLQVKIHSKYFSCGWHRTYICNLPLQQYIACNKGSKQIMPPTANQEGWVRKAGLCLFHLRLVVGEVWFVPLTISVHFNLANASKIHNDGALQMQHEQLLH